MWKAGTAKLSGTAIFGGNRIFQRNLCTNGERKAKGAAKNAGTIYRAPPRSHYQIGCPYLKKRNNRSIK